MTRYQWNLRAFFTSASFGSLFFVASVNATEVPSSFTLDGNLFSDAAGTTPLVDSSVGLRLQVLNQDKSCILYEEQQTVSTVPTNGRFSVQVGSALLDAKRTSEDPGHTMATVYQNETNIAGVRVADGLPCTHTAAAASRRHLRVTVNSSVIAGGAKTLSPDLAIDAVPHALVAGRAETLGGVAKDQFLRVNTSGSNQLTQANLESVFSSSGNVTSLNSLISGTNTNYVRAVANTGAAIPTFAGDPSTPTAGSIWYDSVGQTLRLQTSGGAVSLSSGSGGGYVAGDTILAAPGSAASPGLSFSSAGNSDNGIFLPTDNQIGISTAGTERIRIDAAGNIGVGSSPEPNSRLRISGAATSLPNVISSGGSVDLSLSNIHYLESVGGSTITLSNIANGGSYTIIINDLTPRTYSFTGCTNSYYSPSNGDTVDRSTYSIVAVVVGANTECFISWVSGYAP